MSEISEFDDAHVRGLIARNYTWLGAKWRKRKIDRMSGDLPTFFFRVEQFGVFDWRVVPRRRGGCHDV